MGKGKELKNKEPKEKKESKESKGNFKKVILYILLLVFIALCTFTGVYFGIKKATTNTAIPNEQNNKEEEEIADAFFEIGEITVNLNDDSGKHYAKLNLSVGYNEKNKELVKELESKKIVLTDSAIFYLKSCSFGDFEASNEKNLKDNLIIRLNEKLQSGVINSIIFTDLILQ